MGSDFQCFCQGSKKYWCGLLMDITAPGKKNTEYEIKDYVSTCKVRVLDLPSLSWCDCCVHKFCIKLVSSKASLSECLIWISSTDAAINIGHVLLLLSLVQREAIHVVGLGCWPRQSRWRWIPWAVQLFCQVCNSAQFQGKEMGFSSTVSYRTLHFL